MNINLQENELRNILSSNAKSLVGKACKRLEILETQNLSINQYRNLVKLLFKETIYESFRDTAFAISCASKKMNFQMDIIRPSKEN